MLVCAVIVYGDFLVGRNGVPPTGAVWVSDHYIWIAGLACCIGGNAFFFYNGERCPPRFQVNHSAFVFDDYTERG